MEFVYILVQIIITGFGVGLFNSLALGFFRMFGGGKDPE